MKIRAFGAFALAAALASVLACGSSTPLTVPTVAPTPTLETFTGTIACCFNSDFNSFTIGQSGNIDITLTALTLGGVPSTISMVIGIGIPSGTTCSLLSGGAVNGPAGASGTPSIAELSGGPLGAGTYCVQVTDVGNVPANATVSYTVTVTHT
jgi:predicted small lipoprotein YifL